jgi:hypothetical protein
MIRLLRGKSGGNIANTLLNIIKNPIVAKAVHGLVGLAGTAGLAYGAKKAFDAAVDAKVRNKADGKGLGPAGYQYTLAYPTNAYPEGYKNKGIYPLHHNIDPTVEPRHYGFIGPEHYVSPLPESMKLGDKYHSLPDSMLNGLLKKNLYKSTPRRF